MWQLASLSNDSLGARRRRADRRDTNQSQIKRQDMTPKLDSLQSEQPSPIQSAWLQSLFLISLLTKPPLPRHGSVSFLRTAGLVQGRLPNVAM